MCKKTNQDQITLQGYLVCPRLQNRGGHSFKHLHFYFLVLTVTKHQLTNTSGPTKHDGRGISFFLKCKLPFYFLFEHFLSKRR